MDPEFNNQAAELLAENDLAAARSLLEAAIREMPAEWSPRGEEDGTLTLACWDMEEFLAASAFYRPKVSGIIHWALGSYSMAWCQLAEIAGEEGNFEEALVCVESGLALEPDHPELWNEKGRVLSMLNRDEEALACFVEAERVRPWAPATQIARALRGQGIALIDFDRLDEAEERLRRSLELEPDNRLARNEIEYIRQLRNEQKTGRPAIPWFLHSFVNPPRDPLTRELLILVEGLPSIPGPRTVGAEEFERIATAFMERGWEGFEEEFNRIAPAREHADYARLKRELLCDDLFRMQVHRRLAEVSQGEMTIEEMFDQIRNEKQRKPQ